MASALPLTMGQTAPPQGAPAQPTAFGTPAGYDPFAPWVDPNADQLAALQAKMNAPPTPMFTPDQVAQNQANNQNQYALGVLGSLSGDQGLTDVGGQILKQALANRQPKYTDHGVYDPLTGDFNYSPDYVYQRAQDQYNTVANRSASQQTQYLMNQQRIAERYQQEQDTNRQRQIDAQIISGGMGLGAGQPTQIGSSPQGWPVFRDKMGRLITYDTSGAPVIYQGGVAPKESSQAPTEDQGKAAGWFAQATKGASDMAQALATDPTSSTPSPLEGVLSSLPRVGDSAVNEYRSPARQMFLHGASAFSEAVLRAATGAGMNEEEIKQKVQELTPQIGDKPPVVAQKLAQQPMYLKVLAARAGKALNQGGPTSAGPLPGQPAVGVPPPAPAAATAPAAAASDPLGLGALFNNPGSQ
jgi:hypothetical protein